MVERLRNSGIADIGSIAWETHICQFYNSKEDLLEILIPYFIEGLKSNEFCMWITSEPLGREDAIEGMRKAMPDFDKYLQNGSIEVLPYWEWYLKDGVFDSRRVLDGWASKLKKATEAGHSGMRISGNTFWLESKNWKEFAEYESKINEEIKGKKIIAICTYSLEKCSFHEILEVAKNHQFSIIKQNGRWNVIGRKANGRLSPELKGIETRYEMIFSNMMDGVAYHKAIYDENGNPTDYIFLDANESFERLTGLKKKQIIGKRVTEVMPGIEKDHGEWIRKYGEVAGKKGGEIRFEDYSRILKRWYDVHAFSPKTGYFVTIFEDITERKRIKQSLIDSEEWAAQLIKYTPVGIFDMDFRGPKFRNVNDAMCQALGYSKEEMMAKNPMELLDEKSREKFKERIMKSMAGGGLQDSAGYKVIAKNGQEYWIALDAKPIYENGAIVGATAVAHDITENKKLEDAIIESEERFRAITETAPVGIAVSGLPGLKSLYTNHTYEKMFGYPANGAEKRGTIEFYCDKNEREQILKALEEKGKITDREINLKKIDGSKFWGAVSIRRITFGGEPALLSTVIDITGRKTSEKKLERVNRTLKALSEIKKRSAEIEDEIGYLNGICSILVNNCGYLLAWAGVAENWGKKRVRPVAQAGFETDYLDTLDISWEEGERGSGPTGTAIRTGKPAVCSNVAADEKFRPWKEEAKKRGFASSIALPLAAGGAAIGAINIYSKETDAFPEDEIELLTEMADDISQGVLSIRMRTKNRIAEEAIAKQQEELRTIFDSVPASIFYKDRENRFLVVNKAFASFMKMPREKLEGKLLYGIYTKNEADKFWKDDLEVIETGKPKLGIIETVQVGKKMLIARTDKLPYRDAKGNIIGIIGFAVDITETKKMEEALKQSEKLYREVVENQTELICRSTPNGALTFVNPAYAKYYGKNPEEMIGKKFYSHVPKHDLKADLAHIRRISIERPTGTIEHRTILPNGDVRWQRWTDTGIFDGNGKMVEIQSVGTDITERKKIEEELTFAKNEWERTFDSMPDMVAIIDSKHRILLANKAMAKKLNLQPKQCGGLNCFKCMHGTNGPPAFCPHSRTIVDGKEHIAEIHEDYLGGDYLITTTPLLDKNGKVIASVHIARDITERKKMENELKQSEELMKKTEEIAHLGSWELDLKTNHLSWSDEVYRIFGLKPQQFTATYDAFLEAVHPDDRAAVNEAYSKSLKNNEDGYEIEHRIIRKSDKRIHYVHEKCRHMRDKNGRIIKSVGMVHDITEKKIADEELRAYSEKLKQALTQKEVLLKEIHHRVKNNLQVVSSLLGIQARMITDPVVHKAIDESKQRIKSIALVHEKIYQSEDVKNINLEEYADTLAGELLRAYKKSEKIKFSNRIRDVSMEMETAVPCCLILHELLTNALKHAFPDDREGKITLSSSFSKNMLTITFEDDGVGMPKVANAKNSKSLGLQLIDTLIEQLDGTISVETGKGTKFSIIIPQRKIS